MEEMCVIMFNMILHATRCFPLIRFMRIDMPLYRVHIKYKSMLSMRIPYIYDAICEITFYEF